MREAMIQTDSETGLRYIEESGQLELNELSEIHWTVEAVEDDHGSLRFAGAAHSVEDFDAIIAKLTTLRSLAAQAREVCGY